MDQPLEALDHLTATVHHEMRWYTNWRGIKVNTYYHEDLDQRLFTLYAIPRSDYQPDLKPIFLLSARIIADKVVIYHDITDKPLFKALLEAGIPREQIILRYRGEVAPDPPEDRGHVETVE
jgi:hypothetical protein